MNVRYCVTTSSRIMRLHKIWHNDYHRLCYSWIMSGLPKLLFMMWMYLCFLHLKLDINCSLFPPHISVRLLQWTALSLFLPLTDWIIINFSLMAKTWPRSASLPSANRLLLGSVSIHLPFSFFSFIFIRLYYFLGHCKMQKPVKKIQWINNVTELVLNKWLNSALGCWNSWVRGLALWMAWLVVNSVKAFSHCGRENRLAVWVRKGSLHIEYFLFYQNPFLKVTQGSRGGHFC